ncbi:hypothetical protein [Mangrovibacter yixingensis]|nr:hypothetical protein [Mangrovibacter yixingensis]
MRQTWFALSIIADVAGELMSKQIVFQHIVSFSEQNKANYAVAAMAEP